MWYTDGVAVFRKSKYNIWPFYLIINEVPFKKRFNLENVILGGLWFGEKKPKPNLFLKPIRDSLLELKKG